jgi:hypothetical protein
MSDASSTARTLNPDQATFFERSKRFAKPAL